MSLLVGSKNHLQFRRPDVSQFDWVIWNMVNTVKKLQYEESSTLLFANKKQRRRRSSDATHFHCVNSFQHFRTFAFQRIIARVSTSIGKRVNMFYWDLLTYFLKRKCTRVFWKKRVYIHTVCCYTLQIIYKELEINTFLSTL